MFSFAALKALLPPTEQEALAEAIAGLVEIPVPDLDTESGERLDSARFTHLQEGAITALSSLYHATDRVERLLRSIEQRVAGESAALGQRLTTTAGTLTHLRAEAAFPHRHAVQVDLTTRESAPAYYGTTDLAALTPVGVTLQRAGEIVQSNYSGLPAARVTVINRLGIPEAQHPVQDPSVVLSGDPTQIWYETICQAQPIRAERDNVPWLAGTLYRYGAACQLCVEFEGPVTVSELELSLLGTLPAAVLEVSCDTPTGRVSCWHGHTGLATADYAGDPYFQTSGHLVLPLRVADTASSRVSSRVFYLTLTQEYAQQLPRVNTPATQQSLRYWRDAQQQLSAQGLTSTALADYETTQTALFDDTTISARIVAWTDWAAGVAATLPTEQRRLVEGIGDRFATITALFAALTARPSVRPSTGLWYTYTYGLQSLELRYVEYNRESRYVSAPLVLDGELRQVRVSPSTAPHDVTVTTSTDETPGHVTFSLALREGSDTPAVPLYPDAWTEIVPRTPRPAQIVNPRHIACTAAGTLFVAQHPARVYTYTTDGTVALSVDFSTALPTAALRVTDLLTDGTRIFARVTWTDGSTHYARIYVYTTAWAQIGDTIPVYDHIVSGLALASTNGTTLLYWSQLDGSGVPRLYAANSSDAFASPAQRGTQIVRTSALTLSEDGSTAYLAPINADGTAANTLVAYTFTDDTLTQLAQFPAAPTVYISDLATGVADEVPLIIAMTTAGDVFEFVRQAYDQYSPLCELPVADIDGLTVQPGAIALYNDGTHANLYVSLPEAHCVQHYHVTPGTTTPFVATLKGWIGAYDDGALHTGYHDAAITTPPITGSAAGQFTSPVGLAVDMDGHLYVADSGNHRIQKFTFAHGSSDTLTFAWWLGRDVYGFVGIHDDTTGPQAIASIRSTSTTGLNHGCSTALNPDGWAVADMVPGDWYTIISLGGAWDQTEVIGAVARNIRYPYETSPSYLGIEAIGTAGNNKMTCEGVMAVQKLPTPVGIDPSATMSLRVCQPHGWDGYFIGAISVQYGETWDGATSLTYATQAVPITGAGWTTLTLPPTPDNVGNTTPVQVNYIAIRIHALEAPSALRYDTQNDTAYLYNERSGFNIPIGKYATTLLVDTLYSDTQEALQDRQPAPGTENGAFDTPFGLACDVDTYDGGIGTPRNPTGMLLVTERGNQRVQRFSNAGVHLHTFGGPGSGPGLFSSPSGIVLWARQTPSSNGSESRDIYVADTGNHRVQRFSQSGSYLGHIDSAGYHSSAGTVAVGTEHELLAPLGLRVSADRRLLVTDGTHRVHAYDVTCAPAVLPFGGLGTELGQLNTPHGVATDATGVVYIADTKNARVMTYHGTDGYYWPRTGLFYGANGEAGLAFDRAVLEFYVVLGDGSVVRYTRTDGSWEHLTYRAVGGGLVAVTTATTHIPYAVSRFGYLYRGLDDGRWSWLATPTTEGVVDVVEQVELFTATDTAGQLALREWPFIDWEGISEFQATNGTLQQYNPNDDGIPLVRPIGIEIQFPDGTFVGTDGSGEPFLAPGTPMLYTIPPAINAGTGDESDAIVLRETTAFLASPVTVSDTETLTKNLDELRDLLPGLETLLKRQSLNAIEHITQRRVYRIARKNLVSPQCKLGVVARDSAGRYRLYYRESATHRVLNLPQVDLVPREGLLVFRTPIPHDLQLSEPVDGVLTARTVTIDDSALRLVVFGYYADAPETTQTRRTPYSTNITDYLYGYAPDPMTRPYRDDVGFDDAAYYPVVAYTHRGRTLALNRVITSDAGATIRVRYWSLALRPRLIADLTRTTGVENSAFTPVLTGCSLLTGRIVP